MSRSNDPRARARFVLVVAEPRGTRRLYRLGDRGVEAVRAYLEQVWGEAARRFRLAAENTGPAQGGGA